MTVAIAAVCKWNYEANEPGWAVITASDRMLTNGDVEYEPSIRKMSFLGPKIILLVAGEMQIHSDAIRLTQLSLKEQSETNVRAVAELYASKIRSLRLKWAVQQHLSIYGLNEHTFLEQQKNMDQELVRTLSRKIESVSFGIEAIVAGLSENGEPDICTIDGLGLSACHSDMGFVSIGIGSGHANLQLMATQYSSHSTYFQRTLAYLYAAKKRAEMAPGVGAKTDMNLITNGGIENITDENLGYLDIVYNDWIEEGRRSSDNAISKLERLMLEAHQRRNEDQKLTASPAKP